MRGSRRGALRRVLRTGIIPAHAGLTFKSDGDADTSRDHPRACGAHLLLAFVSDVLAGSSPRMRGSLFAVYFGDADEGIIPAHAGLTRTRMLGAASARDHPRACGAHLSIKHMKKAGPGSSPRMRGSLLADGGRFGFAGIIPAHAGLTRARACTTVTAWDHPRACGAHA